MVLKILLYVKFCERKIYESKYFSKWELVLCQTCGSQGIHMGCGQLKWANPVWECDECTSILRKYFLYIFKKKIYIYISQQLSVIIPFSFILINIKKTLKTVRISSWRVALTGMYMKFIYNLMDCKKF